MHKMGIKDTYKYQLKIGRKVISHDITSDLRLAEKDCKLRYPEAHIYKIGRKTTYRAAWLWKNKGGVRRYIKHPDKKPPIIRPRQAGYKGLLAEILCIPVENVDEIIATHNNAPQCKSGGGKAGE